MNKKIVKIIVEILWIAMAVFCIGCAIYFQTKGNFELYKFQIIICYALGGISIIMALLRIMQDRNENKRRKYKRMYEQENN